MSKPILAVALVASVTLMAGCSVRTASYTTSPGYAYTYTSTTYGSYPSFYWGYQNYYTPAYYRGVYYSPRAYYGGWRGYRYHGYWRRW